MKVVRQARLELSGGSTPDLLLLLVSMLGQSATCMRVSCCVLCGVCGGEGMLLRRARGASLGHFCKAGLVAVFQAGTAGTTFCRVWLQGLCTAEPGALMLSPNTLVQYMCSAGDAVMACVGGTSAHGDGLQHISYRVLQGGSKAGLLKRKS